MMALISVPLVYAIGMEGHYSVDLGTGIGATVDDCDLCHDFDDPNSTYDGSGSNPNIRWIRQTITYKSTAYTVVYTDPDELADGSPYDGPCEICHNGGNSPAFHNEGVKCTSCHPHFDNELINYFYPTGGGDSYPHIIHRTDPRGPLLEDPGDETSACPKCHGLVANDGQHFVDVSGSQALDLTAVCDNCHSPGGAYDGVGKKYVTPTDPDWEAYGAKYNWRDPNKSTLYNEAGDSLRAAKKKWCVGCHDDAPANSKLDGSGTPAPNVAGDNAQTVYGYWVADSGHGRPSFSYPNGLTCGGTDPEYAVPGCHNLQGDHIDHEPRTYEVQESPPPPVAVNPYLESYRLNGQLDVPRMSHHAGEFQLCIQCHTEVFGPSSNFRYDRTPEDDLLHGIHTDFSYPNMMWDSDYDGVPVGGRTGDSTASCPTCHNVHGAPMDLEIDVGPPTDLHPNVAMIRHGELLGGDELNGLRFLWYTAAGGSTGTGVPTTDRLASLSGELWTNPPSCGQPQACHSADAIYNRDPLGSAAVSVDALYVTNLTDPGEDPSPGDQVRVHTDFRVFGSGTFYLKSHRRNAWSKINQPGIWRRRLPKKEANLPAGTYVDYWTWDKTIPLKAVAGEARGRLRIKIYDYDGGTRIGRDAKKTTFNIAAP
jgi:hypothetical protein